MAGECSWEHDPKDYRDLSFEGKGVSQRFREVFRHIRQLQSELKQELPNGETKQALWNTAAIQEALVQAEIMMRDPEGKKPGTTATPLELRQHAFDLAEELLNKLRQSLGKRGVDNPEEQ